MAINIKVDKILDTEREFDAPHVYIYNSSGGVGYNRFNNWSKLVALLGKIDGNKEVYFEQDETIPTGTHDLNGTTLHCDRISYAVQGEFLTITFADGCVLQNCLGFVDGGLWTTESTSPVITRSSSGVFRIEDGAGVCANNGSELFILGGTSQTIITQLKRGGSILRDDSDTEYGTYEVINDNGTTNTVVIVQDDSSFFHDDTVRGTSGVYVNIIQSIAADLATNQDQMATHANYTYSTSGSQVGSGYWVNDDIDFTLSDYTVTMKDNQRTIASVGLSSGNTITLPEAQEDVSLNGGVGQKVTVVNVSANYSTTVATSGSDTIEGGSSYTLDSNWRAATFQATPLGGGAYGWVIIHDYNPSTGGVTVDTKNTIIQSTPSSPTVAFASDTNEWFIYDGSGWFVASIKLNQELPAPDIGYTQDNDKQGYGPDYITGKYFTDVALGAFSGEPYEGAFRVRHGERPVFEIYLRGQWNDLIYTFTVAETGLVHVPETYTINVRTGDSVEIGLNEVPIVRDYKVCRGAYPMEAVIGNIN